MTAGTNHPATRSTSRWIGGFEACASCTIATMRASTVSAPTRGRAEAECPGVVDRPRDHRISGALVDRQALAGQHGLVDRAGALHDLAVHRQPISRPHHHEVSPDDFLGGDLDLRTPADHARGARAQIHQAVERARGAPARACLERLPEHDERDHDRGRLVERMCGAHREEARRGDRGGRVDPRRARAQGDQRVHVRLAPPERRPRPREEARAHPEQVRKGEHPRRAPQSARIRSCAIGARKGRASQWPMTSTGRESTAPTANFRKSRRLSFARARSRRVSASPSRSRGAAV